MCGMACPYIHCIMVCNIFLITSKQPIMFELCAFLEVLVLTVFMVQC
jgi:hypothetical protein